MKIEGECMAVTVEDRADCAPLITIHVEDDGNWFEKMSFDAAWLPELQMLLAAAYRLSQGKNAP
jgi:hypothetical protein